jgi:tetratricopeptide (TPR) repeat protein
MHSNDGLQMRRKIGKRNLIGLSMNTLGMIEIRQGSPERARFHCEKALKIFRDTEFAPGVGLSCLALAEAFRRVTNMDLLNNEETLEYLEAAKKYAEEALDVFTKQVKQPLRQVETYIEVGCLYREWARYLPADDPRKLEMVQKSEDAYEAAVMLAMGGEYEYRAIDALVNLAWLYYYAKDVEKAIEVLSMRVRDHLGDSHLFTHEHGVDKDDSHTSWNWVQLGKANNLLGKIHFDEYNKADRAKDKTESEKKLRQAAHNWTLSLAYNSLYGKDFRDFGKARRDIYECLNDLNSEEMGWIIDSMNQTHRKYHVSDEQRAFEQLLKDRFGLVL